ncbi:MAG TPA: hypothetical protein VMS65_15245, partial [Polyangiaceae bacterium]|nr:hypothetical protein [Polyangiaceae bacterium]
TATAVLTHINDARASLGRRALELAREQSSAMQPLQERIFSMYAVGNFENDVDLVAEALRGKAVRGPIWWANIVSGIAFDGDAADWLAYRFLLPSWRSTLMAHTGDQLALATHGDSNVGFGATAVVYSLFTPERELELADAIAARIAEAREKLETHRLETPLEFVEAARDVASGRSTPEQALSIALGRLNVHRREKTYLDGLVLDLPWTELDFEVPDVLLDFDDLTYGVIVTHHKFSRDDWARAVAFVWFVTARPSQTYTNNERPERRGI